jgi:phosphoglycolate phosphatase-like HAD superfamily hydrolase
MSPREVILALDFNGVLWDTAGECYQMAARAYARLYRPLDRDLEEPFRAGRWLARTGGEFLLLLQLPLENPGLDMSTFPKEQFARLVRERAAAIRAFEPEFYRQRDLARTNEREAWLAMQRPYPEILSEWPALRQAFGEVVLCTTKDQASARELLASAGLELPILGREFAVDKARQMEHLAETRGVPTARILLLDDLLDNLLPVLAVGSRAALATWGYNTPAERQEAARRGIPLIRAGQVLEGLQAALNP